MILGTWWLLRELELACAQIQHVTFSCGADNLVEATWLLPASKTDPQAVGVARSHGCCCGGCRFGDPDPDLENFSGEPLATALCPVRAAARHVGHVLDLCLRIGADIEGFPLLPQLSGVSGSEGGGRQHY